MNNQLRPTFSANGPAGLSQAAALLRAGGKLAVIGAGNIYRGLMAAEGGMDRARGDYMGMTLTIEDLAGTAGIFLGSGSVVEPDVPVTLQRDDPRLASTLSDYEHARPGVYIRTVSDESRKSEASAVSEEAIERLRALGYDDAGPG